MGVGKWVLTLWLLSCYSFLFEKGRVGRVVAMGMGHGMVGRALGFVVVWTSWDFCGWGGGVVER